MRINLRYLIVILGLLLLAAALARAQTGTDPGLPDSVMVDSVVTHTGSSGVVPLNFFNDEELASVEVTLRHSTSAVNIDSFSFVGSRISYIPNKDYVVLDDSTFTIFILPTQQALIPPGTGLLGTIYYSWDQSIFPQVVTIDTTRVLLPDLREYATTFKVEFQDPFIPRVRRGYLDIEATPFALDSIWLANIDATAGTSVVLDVYMYNQRNTKDVSVALEYSPDYLAFDSASFQGTRGQFASATNVQRNNSIGKLWAVLTYGDTTPLVPGSGTLMHLHFTVDPLAPDTLLFVDSTTYISPGNDVHINLTSADGSIQIIPFFTQGSLTVSVATGIADDGGNGLPATYSLSQNYPNPFNPSTVIEFALPRGGEVRLDVYNILGQRVKTLVDQYLPAGQHQATFDGRNDGGNQVASGVYFYRLTAGDFTESKKMVLVK